MRAAALCLLLTASTALAGCASIRGAQHRMVELTPRAIMPMDNALLAYRQIPDSARLGMNRRDFRDYILTTYIGAIEERYDAFVTALEMGDRGSALGLDLLLLALSGATSLVPLDEVEDLANITTIAAGARATIDRRVFFDRTVPALIAAMDAERATVLAQIVRKRTLPVEQYSLDEGVDDLRRLQRAGRLNSALTRIARAAEADRAQQQARLDTMTTGCEGNTVNTVPINISYRDLIIGTPAAGTEAVTEAQRAALAQQELALDLAPGTVATFEIVWAAYLSRFCNDPDRTAFIQRVRARIDAAAGGGGGG